MDVDVLLGKNVQISEYLPLSAHVRICDSNSIAILKTLELWSSEFKGPTTMNRGLYDKYFEPSIFRASFYNEVLRHD